jgi:hypothetical protein
MQSAVVWVMLLDLLYLTIGTAFFVVCWFFVKACERL